MGAYESQRADDCDGDGWSDPCSATDYNFKDCNHNGIYDYCEGCRFRDCDRDGVLDSCVGDSDGDGLLDACDAYPQDFERRDLTGLATITIGQCPPTTILRVQSQAGTAVVLALPPARGGVGAVAVEPGNWPEGGVFPVPQSDLERVWSIPVNATDAMGNRTTCYVHLRFED
jgi:hypothetical protein